MARSVMTGAGMIIAAFGLSVPTIAQSDPPITRSDIDAGKRSIIEYADRGIAENLPEYSKSFEPVGVTLAQFRTTFRWAFYGATIGNCAKFASPGDKENWLAKLDQLELGDGKLATATIRELTKKNGLEYYDWAASDAQADPNQWGVRHFCLINLPAVRELLAELGR
ncbi:hypothetical protein [Sphingomonas colocasiae]|uniref:Uncharacterized protein n=1 Tax=Sphingomonas colocasiae TaxID=1848973 RepID=A0ABS7PNS7_9SPHN|nr:hypothetical protein [Sphingomonas colocasiae]MBY8822649.1 hypothetical protein [Sphingomonas colocasiae]